jgi:hypothetical protein
MRDDPRCNSYIGNTGIDSVSAITQAFLSALHKYRIFALNDVSSRCTKLGHRTTWRSRGTSDQSANILLRSLTAIRSTISKQESLAQGRDRHTAH